MRIGLLSRLDCVERVHQQVARGPSDAARKHGLRILSAYSCIEVHEARTDMEVRWSALGFNILSCHRLAAYATFGMFLDFAAFYQGA